MTKFSTLLISLTFFTLYHASAQWQWQNPMPQGNPLNQAQWINNQTIVAVGMLNTFIRSDDAGATWKVQHYIGGPANTLQSVHFTDTQNGWAVDYYPGNVYTTTDGGQTWNYTLLHNWLNKVYYNGADGYILGDSGISYRSHHGGAWTALPVQTQERLVDIEFTAVDTGFILAEQGYIYRSVDSGATWSYYITLPPVNTSLGRYYRAFSVFNSNQFRGVGRPAMAYSTNNAGAKWDTAVIYYPEDFQDVFFMNPDTGVAVGGYFGEQYGNIFRSTDGGKTWSDIDISYYWPRSVAFANNLQGIIVGLGGETMLSNDGGQTYQRNPDYNSGFTGLDYSGSKGLITANSMYQPSYTLSSSDRGKTWTKGPDITGQQLFDVAFSNGDTATAVGAWGSIYRTTDAGANWTQVHTPLLDTGQYYYSIQYPTRDTGYIAGSFGTILKTTNGGLKWVKLPTNTTDYFSNVFFVNGRQGYATKDIYLNIFRTFDGGQTWDSVDVVPASGGGLKSVYFFDTDTGFAVGYGLTGGQISRTTDAGKTWTTIPSNTVHDVIDIHFSGRDTGVAACYWGTILQTVNGGLNWQVLKTPVAIDHLARVNLLAGDEGTIVGQNVILHQGSGGIITAAPAATPATTKLLGDVYPNPFTERTTFTLNLAQNTLVRASIYNLMGQEVQLLFNHAVKQGVQTIEWIPAASLPAGIYFLRVQAAGQTETRKLVLTK